MNQKEIERDRLVRHLTAASLKYDGLKLHEIGEMLGGVTKETARQLVIKGQQKLLRNFNDLNDCAEMIGRGLIPKSHPKE